MRIGIIGGGFFWGLWGKEYSTTKPITPYGNPSDHICCGSYADHQVFTLQRHGARHEYDPTSVPWKANIYAMYLQQLDFIIHVTTCGALNSQYKPGDIVLFDQILDLTKNRPSTFGPPVIEQVTHLNMAEPISWDLIKIAQAIFQKNNVSFQVGGTMVTEEGPRFATNAETKMYRLLGGNLINQTSAPEVFLCYEIGLPVLALTLVTNKVEIDNSAQDVGYDDIAENIAQFKTVVPNAIRILLENIKEVSIIKPEVKPFDVAKLDLRPI